MACIYMTAYVKDPVVHVRVWWINSKTPGIHPSLGSATPLQMAFPGEGNPNFPWKKPHWDNTVVKSFKKINKKFRPQNQQALLVHSALTVYTNVIEQNSEMSVSTVKCFLNQQYSPLFAKHWPMNVSVKAHTHTHILLLSPPPPQLSHVHNHETGLWDIIAVAASSWTPQKLPHTVQPWHNSTQWPFV